MPQKSERSLRDRPDQRITDEGVTPAEEKAEERHLQLEEDAGETLPQAESLGPDYQPEHDTQGSTRGTNLSGSTKKGGVSNRETGGGRFGGESK
jgi:hypothetical protein